MSIEFQHTENKIEIFKTNDNHTEVKVRFEQETVWLDAHTIASLFTVNRPAIVKHIQNIYKSYYADDFKSNKATLFSTSINCSDYKYLKDEEYIIFGYTEPDTGLIYSDNCTYTRKLSELSKAEIEKLELLNIEYWKNNKGLKSINKLDDLYINNPNVPIKKIRRESELINERYNKTKKEIKIQQIINYILVGVIAVVMLLFILKRLKNKKET